jgi:hypothetical protein
MDRFWAVSRPSAFGLRVHEISHWQSMASSERRCAAPEKAAVICPPYNTEPIAALPAFHRNERIPVRQLGLVDKLEP